MVIGTQNEKDTPNFDQLIDKIAKDPTQVKSGDALIELAYKELDALRAKLALAATQDRGKLKVEMDAKTERDRAGLDVERNRMQLPGEVRMEYSKFVKLADEASVKFNSGTTMLQLNIQAERLKVDPMQWSTNTDEALNRVYVEWRELGVPVTEDPFYHKMFSVLRDKNNPEKEAVLKSNPAYAEWFRNPEQNLDNISKIAPDIGGKDNSFPQAFVKAYTHFAFVRTKMLAIGNQHSSTLEKQRALDGHAVIDKPMDFARANLAKFTKAIKDGDWATAGVYALGVYAIYKSIVSLVGDKATEAKKYALYGIAGYCGYVFAKNAGYDLLKMAGFKDKDAEVRGTPMEAIAGMNLPEAKDLDYNIMLRISEVKMGYLNQYFEKANSPGKEFIHPSNFGDIFPEVANIGYFDMGIGEKGLSDNTGNVDKKLTPKQREYVRIGQQLYKAMLVMRAAYNKTLLKENGESFEVAMKKPELADAKVRHFCSMLGLYNFATSEAGLTASREADKARAQLDTAFSSYKETPVGFNITGEATEGDHKKAGIYKGVVMGGYPVFFAYDVAQKHYKVYLANEFGGIDVPGKNYVAEIPLQGEAMQKEQIGKLVKAVNARMAKLLGMVRTSSPNSKPPTYDGGAWTATVRMPGNPEFDVPEHDSKVKLVPTDTGKGLIVHMEDSPVSFNLDEQNAERIPLTMNMVQGLFKEKSFDALKPFFNRDMMVISDPTAGDSKFMLNIKKLNRSLEIKYDKGTKKYELANPSDEADLLNDPAFSTAYIEALDTDPDFELNKTFVALEATIGKLSTSLLGRTWDAIKGNTSGGSLSRWDITNKGVPKNYAKMITENARLTVLARLQGKIDKQRTFAGVEQARKETLADGENKIKGINTAIVNRDAELQGKGQEWDQNEFMNTVVTPVRLAGTESASYASSQTEMEQAIYKLDLPGLEGFDFAQGAHTSAGKLMQVFTYRTAHLDNEKHKFKLPDPSKPGSFIVDHRIVYLDPPALVFPATPTAGISDPKEDPGLRGHMVNRYFKYVREKIYTKASQLPSLEAAFIPAPKSGEWGIKDFDEWAETEQSYQPIDTVDNRPAFKHDLKEHLANKNTELDKALKAEYDKAVTALTKELGPGVLNTGAIGEYLRGIDPDNPGIFATFQDAAGVWRSTLWDNTARISRDSNGKRSTQVQLMQAEVQAFTTMIFTKDEVTKKYPFLLQQPSVWEKGKLAIIRKWPGLATFELF
jgi:hypothetical protein